ncbi:copper resistance CopC family protein [Amycolatopsis sp. NPDC059657]|uniref:copper resistance CopC family protein n=1 Tax=Amycolatopsis sp. NPDC059657 TaxID=3346899 RepID=UPI00366D47DD
MPIAGTCARVLAAAALLLLTMTPPAGAHSVLLSSSPPKESSVATSPAEVTLEFNEPLEPGFTELVVIGPDSVSHWEAAPPHVSGATVSAPVRTLGSIGQYSVRYRVISADGHPVSGAFGFTLTVAGGGAPAEVAGHQQATPIDRGFPLWPWISGMIALLITGGLVANRLATRPAAEKESAKTRSA